jgi:TM2 domain-containing membrane protein YozV
MSHERERPAVGPERYAEIEAEELARAEIRTRLARGERDWKPGIAAVLSFFVPGLGQIYKAQILDGLLFLFFTLVGIAFAGPGGFLVWILSIYNAATFDPDKPSMALSGRQILWSSLVGLLFLTTAYLFLA